MMNNAMEYLMLFVVWRINFFFWFYNKQKKFTYPNIFLAKPNIFDQMKKAIVKNPFFFCKINCQIWKARTGTFFNFLAQ